MPDYGHDLQVGTFLTPSNARPEAVVDLAVGTERAGLDLVTFQDHPYQPSFLDTWTLLTWVAARTSRVHVAGNVLNLPLRPPGVLARAVASLDLLSGGRAALGLGAGAFWDGIAAMGGPRLSPGEGVTALSEGIDVIRALWDADATGVVRVEGDHHRVVGAKRGPAPAHDVPIWLGAYKPRMLRLVGTKADGWLPSMGYLKPGDLARGNAVIDEAAAAAGRDPREIRRLLNLTPGGEGLLGDPADWADQLLGLALDDGIATFILGTDDARLIDRFGAEVAPALREMVAAERAHRGSGGADAAAATGRSARALAARLPDIDYDAVPPALAARAVEPGDREYAQVRSSYVWRGAPGLVLRPTTPDEVTSALAFARRQGVPIAVRSGGHGISGRSTNNGGIVIDVRGIDHVEVLDRERRIVRVGAGAVWGDVAAALAPHGLAISSGDYGDVGVGGLATAGGQGFLARSYGLTIDHVVGADVVLADGRQVRADATEHPDLFWGLRGAGGNLGIVTSFDIEATELGDVVFAVLVQQPTDLAEFLVAWGDLVEHSPRELTPFLTIAGGGPTQPAVAQAYHVWAGDDPDAAVAAIEPFLGLAPVAQQQAQLAPYAAVVAPHHNRHAGQARMTSVAAMVDHLDPATAGRLASLVGSGRLQMVQVRSVGGAVNDVPADAMAYGHRTAAFSLLGSVRAGAGAPDEWDALAAQGVYLSFQTDDHDLARVFPAGALDRLRALKATYDPENVFRANVPIPPAGTGTGAVSADVRGPAAAERVDR